MLPDRVSNPGPQTYERKAKLLNVIGLSTKHGDSGISFKFKAIRC